ncbi:MAG: OsmC family protein [Anaerolineales bacterium]|nr:OsmC family protein [Anaerolineales bacterium]
MNTKVIWQEGMHFSGTANSGFNVQLDAKQEVGGEGKGFVPMELMALSLAGCTAMDVISILRKKRQDVTGFEVQVDAPRADEHPKVFTRATIEYLVTGHAVGEAAVLRAIELTAESYCPAQAMLGKVMPIDLRYKIFEDEVGEKRLVAEGVYAPEEAIV